MWTSLNSKDNMIVEMFKTALQIEEPWKLTYIEFDDKEQAWHLFLDFNRETVFAAPCVETL